MLLKDVHQIWVDPVCDPAISPFAPGVPVLPRAGLDSSVPGSRHSLTASLVGVRNDARQVGSKVQEVEKNAVLNHDGCGHLG